MTPKKKNQFEKDLAERMEILEYMFKKSKIEHKKQIEKIKEDYLIRIEDLELKYNNNTKKTEIQDGMRTGRNEE